MSSHQMCFPQQTRHLTVPPPPSGPGACAVPAHSNTAEGPISWTDAGTEETACHVAFAQNGTSSECKRFFETNMFLFDIFPFCNFNLHNSRVTGKARTVTGQYLLCLLPSANRWTRWHLSMIVMDRPARPVGLEILKEAVGQGDLSWFIRI